MQFFLIEIEIEISLLTKSVPQEGIYILQITIMIDTQQQYIKLNIQGEISIIVKNKFFMTILRLIRRVSSSKDVNKINKKCFLYAETYMLRFVQIRNNRYENRLIFLLLANTNLVLP